MTAPKCQTPDPNRPVKEYGCTKCQKWHTEFEPEYEEHLHRQAKHHYRERPPEPWEVFRRMMTEGN